MNRLPVFAALIALVPAIPARTASAQTPPPAALSDSAARALITQRVEAGMGVGIVAGLLDARGPRIVSYGQSGNGRPLDGSTVFEIGSISKVFTALLLADMVQKGEVALDDPVSKYLPAAVKVPARDGRQITLLDLATQSSGLPRMPANFTPKDPANPYADYTVQQLYDFLSSYQLPRLPGARYEYSNLGFALLGHALALRAGKPWEQLVQDRVIQPLGLSDTRVTLTPSMKARLATGHADGEPAASWALTTFAPAGALRSTANDMLRFVAAAMDSTGPLAPLFRATEQSRRVITPGRLEIGLGWHILHLDGHDIVWHNGGTGGYHALAAFEPASRRAVVLLANSTDDIDDIGMHLLDPAGPVREPPRLVTVAPEVLDRYVGEYQLAPTFVIDVTRTGGKLFIQATGQPRIRVFASSDREFFLTAVDARITFVTEAATGPATALVLHQNGMDQTARRVP
jgi:CubicO group peptidase (beta-lactamase class C family)